MDDMKDLADFVNLNEYPIDRLDSAAGQQFLSDCHEQMNDTTLCALPGFLTETAVAAIASELDTLAENVHQHDYPATAYSWRDNSAFAEDHPRGMLFRRACGILTTDQFKDDGASNRLFQFDELTDSVRRMLKFDTLYRSACPTLSIQSNIMAEQHQFGWHFDTNDGVVSFMIREADTGGEFNYAPLIRDEDDDNYTGVARLFREQDPGLIAPMPAGTFSLFMGRRSAHRVTPVGATSNTRLSLLFSYDQQPGMIFPERSCQRILQPDNRPYRGAGPVA